MNPHRHIQIAAINLCTAALLCAAANASAQVVYKHISLAGGISYTDQSADLSQSDPEASPAADAAARPGKRSVLHSWRAALVDVTEATRRLAQAQQKRRQGLTPLPGEGVQSPSGIAVNARYWHRQEKLRIEVEQAQRRSNETQKLQLAQR